MRYDLERFNSETKIYTYHLTKGFRFRVQVGRRRRWRREIFRRRIRNFRGFEDFISHLTRELKWITVPIPSKELITSPLASIREREHPIIRSLKNIDRWRIADDSSCDGNASMILDYNLRLKRFFVNPALLSLCAPEVKCSPFNRGHWQTRNRYSLDYLSQFSPREH